MCTCISQTGHSDGSVNLYHTSLGKQSSEFVFNLTSYSKYAFFNI